MSKAVSQQQVQSVRQFNRVFTKRVGLLERTPYDSTLSITEARVLFELSQRQITLAKELADALGVDKGYLSRVIASLQKKGIVTLKAHAEDKRQKTLLLTAKGKAKFKEIDRSSASRSEELLKPLGELNRAELAKHINAANLILRDQDTLTAADVTLRHLEPGDLGWVIGRHGEIYHDEFGWNGQLEILTAEIALGFVKDHDPKRERAWIAHINGVRVGCVFLIKENQRTAKLRILLVDPMARGLGIGTMLVEECLRFARQAGYQKMVLWTNGGLDSARRIYEAQGFLLEKEEPHSTFGKRLVGQYWSKDL